MKSHRWWLPSSSNRAMLTWPFSSPPHMYIISVDGSHFTVFFCITGPLGGKPIPLKSILYSKQPASGKLMKEGRYSLSKRYNVIPKKIPKTFLATYVLHHKTWTFRFFSFFVIYYEHFFEKEIYISFSLIISKTMTLSWSVIAKQEGDRKAKTIVSTGGIYD